ncbi:hypothetical protein B9Z19DRAFT_1196267 [Tuber borchii]|uniref:Uncharacterized protein n=1 Tax=Tuber borchii TaxID=42251 RepID=A0A2T6ZFX7_TUBBO|nr:hypothetical protein B9Z19DRAFT_1196267 [Tuber borchii]
MICREPLFATCGTDFSFFFSLFFLFFTFPPHGVFALFRSPFLTNPLVQVLIQSQSGLFTSRERKVIIGEKSGRMDCGENQEIEDNQRAIWR